MNKPKLLDQVRQEIRMGTFRERTEGPGHAAARKMFTQTA